LIDVLPRVVYNECKFGLERHKRTGFDGIDGNQRFIDGDWTAYRRQCGLVDTLLSLGHADRESLHSGESASRQSTADKRTREATSGPSARQHHPERIPVQPGNLFNSCSKSR